MQVQDEKMLNIEGGGTLAASFFTNFAGIFKTIYSIGNELGGAIRRIATKNVCPF